MAVADHPHGPFKPIRALRPNGLESLDINLFVDGDEVRLVGWLIGWLVGWLVGLNKSWLLLLLLLLFRRRHPSFFVFVVDGRCCCCCCCRRRCSTLFFPTSSSLPFSSLYSSRDSRHSQLPNKTKRVYNVCTFLGMCCCIVSSYDDDDDDGFRRM